MLFSGMLETTEHLILYSVDSVYSGNSTLCHNALNDINMTGLFISFNFIIY